MAASSVYKVLGELNDPSGTGVLGVNNAGSGNAYGVQGVTASNAHDAAGVRGAATGSSGRTRGVLGTADSAEDFASGLFGQATQGSGQTFGVFGRTQSSHAAAEGVRGVGSNGESNGVKGVAEDRGDGVIGAANSAEGAGIRGYNTATSGQSVGIFGAAESSTDGTVGIRGLAPATTGRTMAIEGLTHSETKNAAGVMGRATASGVTAGTVGVWGITNANGGSGAIPNGVRGVSNGDGPSAGVSGQSLGDSQGVGVFGRSLNGTGIRGQADSGADGTTAIFGHAAATSGRTCGVEGITYSEDDAATGVRGRATASGVLAGTNGVEGISEADGDPSSDVFPIGVIGRALGSGGTTGVSGVNPNDPDGAGVFGGAQEGTGIIGHAESSVDGTTAIEGEALAGSGSTIGVSGVVNSPDGYGVYSDGDSRTVGDHEVTGTVAVGNLVSKRAHTKAYLSTSQSVPYATAEKIQFDAVAGDDFSSTSGGFDTSTHSYFVPADGHYRVDASVAYNDPMEDLDNHNLYFYLNGSIEASWRRQTGNTTGEFVHDHGSTLLMDLSTGDEIHVAIEHHVDSGVDVQTGKEYTHVSISHVG